MANTVTSDTLNDSNLSFCAVAQSCQSCLLALYFRYSQIYQ